MDAEIKVEVSNPDDWKVALAKLVLGGIAGFVAHAAADKFVDRVVEFRQNNDTVEVPVP